MRWVLQNEAASTSRVRSTQIARLPIPRKPPQLDNMRIAFLVSALAALATAFPYPQGQENFDGPDNEPSDHPDTIAVSFATPTVPIQLTTSLNIPITGLVALPTLAPGYDTTSTSRKNPHLEPIPVFTKACTCDVATVKYPCWATDSLQVSDLAAPYRRRRTSRIDICAARTILTQVTALSVRGKLFLRLLHGRRRRMPNAY